MNFFGHAAVAELSGVDDPAALGAMLPDFASMLGMRMAGVDDGAVARGVTLHHATDEVFHRAPAFVTLCGHAVEELETRGLSRGSARAVAHVGTELLLDGWLVQQGIGVETYGAALTAAGHDGLRDRVRWRAPRAAERVAWLIDQLRHHGPPRDYADTRVVADRLARALQRRPRLRLSPEDLPRVEVWLEAFGPRVHAQAPGLLQHVRRGLAHPSSP